MFWQKHRSAKWLMLLTRSQDPGFNSSWRLNSACDYKVLHCVQPFHYENMSIQIYWKFYHQKWKFLDKKFWYFSYFCSKHRLWVLVIEPPWWAGSYDITKTYLYNFDPLKPHFYIVKLGFTGVYIIFLISAQKHRLWYSLELPHRGSLRQF